RPTEPSGRERESARKTAKPTTTGGKPMSALSTTMTASRPEKRVSATRAPNGTPKSAATNTAERLTASDSRTIATSAGSAVSTSWSAERSLGTWDSQFVPNVVQKPQVWSIYVTA